jgi:hypothetical protein
MIQEQLLCHLAKFLRFNLIAAISNLELKFLANLLLHEVFCKGPPSEQPHFGLSMAWTYEYRQVVPSLLSSMITLSSFSLSRI